MEDLLGFIFGWFFGVNEKGTHPVIFVISTIVRLAAFLLGVLLLLAGIFLENFKTNDAARWGVIGLGLLFVVAYAWLQIASTRNFLAGRKERKQVKKPENPSDSPFL